MTNRIRQLREERGFSLERLAVEAGTTFQQVQRLEKGERRLTQSWMVRLATPLQVRPADLVDWDAGRDQTQASPAGEFVKDPEELAWLGFWRAMDKGPRRTVVTMIEAISRPKGNPT